MRARIARIKLSRDRAFPLLHDTILESDKKERASKQEGTSLAVAQ